LDTIPSSPSLHTCSKMISPSPSRCSEYWMPWLSMRSRWSFALPSHGAAHASRPRRTATGQSRRGRRDRCTPANEVYRSWRPHRDRRRLPPHRSGKMWIRKDVALSFRAASTIQDTSSPVAITTDKQSVAIVLDLVHPPGTAGRLVRAVGRQGLMKPGYLR
jgi:hypothetical protein